MFNKGYEIKLYFTPLLNYFSVKHFCTTVNNTQTNAPLEWVYQVMFNMPVTKDLDKRFFDHIYSWGETLAYIA